MDIIEFAIQMELDGKAFYENGAAATQNPELKKVLVTLAKEEEKHYRVFKSLAEGDPAAAEDTLGGKSDVPGLTKSVFRKLTESGVESLGGDDAQALWQSALEIEEKSERMYREAADQEKDGTRKRLLHRIADEEKNHIYLCDNMLAFAKDPSSFVASAQYKNFMSWEGH